MSDQPRILFCCFDVVPAPHALSRRLTEYIKGLGDRYQVVVLSNKTPDHSHIERYHGARLLRVPVGGGDYAARALAFDRAVRRQIESEEYLLVHFFDPFGGYALCERRAEFGYKLVYDAAVFPSVDLPYQHAQVAQNRRFIAKVRRQELFCLMNADAVLVSSQVTQDYVASLGVSREHVRVVRAPVNREPFSRELMGRPDATPMKLIHLGSLFGYHDLEVLLEAMSLALQTVDVRLVLVSPKTPEHMARVQEKVNALKLAGKVELQDPVVHDDVHKILAVADVGLLTLGDNERARKVGSPIARAGEYLAGGRPIIAADLPVTREVVPAEAGVFYTPGDARSLADAIVSLASDPRRRVALGEAARTASESWDSAAVAKKLMGVYAKLTGVEPVPEQTSAAADQVTQLGKVSEDSNASTQVGEKRPDTNTDPAAASDRPAILGTLLREDATPIRSAAEAAAGGTDPMASRAAPVIMGEPLHDGSLADATPRPGPPVPEEPQLSPAVPATLRSAHAAPAPSAAPPASPPTTKPAAAGASTGKTLPSLPVAPAPDAAPPPQAPAALRATPAPRADVTSRPTPAPGLAAPAAALTLRPTPEPSVAPPAAALRSTPAQSPQSPTPAPAPHAPPAAATLRPSPTPAPQGRASTPPPGAQAPPAELLASPGPPPLPPSGGAARRLTVSSSPSRAAAPAASPPAERLPAAPSAPPIPLRTQVPRLTATTSESLEAVAENEVHEVAPNEVIDEGDEPAEVSDNDVHAVDDEHPAPADEVPETDDVAEAGQSGVHVAASALEPWFTQLVHGYCPPVADLFNRHTPPTTMPGRDP